MSGSYLVGSGGALERVGMFHGSVKYSILPQALATDFGLLETAY